MNTSSLLIIAIVSAIGLIGVTAINIMLTIEEAEAQQPPTKGCINPHAPAGGSIAFNASEGRCFHGFR